MINLHTLTLYAWRLPARDLFTDAWKGCSSKLSILNLAVMPHHIDKIALDIIRLPRLTQFTFTLSAFNEPKKLESNGIQKCIEHLPRFLNNHKSHIRILKFIFDFGVALRPRVDPIVEKLEQFAVLESFMIRGAWKFPMERGKSALGNFVDLHSTKLITLDVADVWDPLSTGLPTSQPLLLTVLDVHSLNDLSQNLHTNQFRKFRSMDTFYPPTT